MGYWVLFSIISIKLTVKIAAVSVIGNTCYIIRLGIENRERYRISIGNIAHDNWFHSLSENFFV